MKAAALRRSRKTTLLMGHFVLFFMEADRVDMFLLVLGFIRAMSDGLLTPLMTFLTVD